MPSHLLLLDGEQSGLRRREGLSSLLAFARGGLAVLSIPCILGFGPLIMSGLHCAVRQQENWELVDKGDS